MSEISIPYHLALPVLLGILIISIMVMNWKKIFKNNGQKWLWISIAVFWAVYVLVVGRVLVDDLYCQWNLNRYDLNRDGLFGGKEITTAQAAAMARLTNDTNRNFAPITGVVYSLIISLPVYLAETALAKIKKISGLKNGKGAKKL